MKKNVIRCFALITLLGASALIGCSGESHQSATRSTDGPKDVIETARISPQTWYTNSVLEVKFESKRAVEMAEFVFVWKRNGEPIDGAHGSLLNPEHFQKGDRISVDVRDAIDGEKHFETPAAAIVNSPPKIIRASTSMGMRTKPEIFLHIESADPDQDALSYSYQWFRNDKAMKKQMGDALDPSVIQRGDRIHAQIIATDGTANSTPFLSDPITVQNHAPRITSKPVPPKSADEAFYYQVVAEDVDSDQLSYELISAPRGMAIDSQGTIAWVYPSREERAGKHNIKVRVSDPKGGVVIQEFNLTFSTSPDENSNTE